MFETFDWSDVEALAKRFTELQDEFEYNCGFRTVGQEIMVISGFALLYNIQKGFEDTEEKAWAMFHAYQKCMCSMEIKYESEKIARLYHIIE